MRKTQPMMRTIRDRYDTVKCEPSKSGTGRAFLLMGAIAVLVAAVRSAAGV
jgi:hypothetical protein